jgi:hypothetical protein
MFAGNSCAAYMRQYRKRKRLEEDNCNNVTKQTKLNAERQHEYRETYKNLCVEYMHNYRKLKAQEIKTAQIVQIPISVLFQRICVCMCVCARACASPPRACMHPLGMTYRGL